MTQIQAAVAAALAELGLVEQPGPPGVMGAPSQLEVTKVTVEKLKGLVGRTYTVDAQGNVTLNP